MGYYINSTQAYHIREMNSLGWELTVSNCLYPDRSPCRSVLSKRVPYGWLLYEFLDENIPLKEVKSILEIGGGYGYLMQDFLKRNAGFRLTMADISPFLLGKQKKNLADFPVTFLLSDVRDLSESLLKNHDLAILNENVGDFPTAVNLTASAVLVDDDPACGPEMMQIRTLFKRYAFPLPPTEETFNFNLGAVLATEKLCRAKIPYIFISEHSCEASVPDDLRDLIPVSATGNPQRIPLKGHDEYTIRFSDLEIVAGHLGYYVQRGPLADFVQPDFNDSLKWLLKRRHSSKDEHEILRQFIEDLYQYEYLLLVGQADQWERTATIPRMGD
ncbi:MAG: hypothetical protein JW902_06445 [Syntrophaceae bacterium]|nr:hypothetical protein [Syntrophaceae bacterium]